MDSAKSFHNSFSLKNHGSWVICFPKDNCRWDHRGTKTFPVPLTTKEKQKMKKLTQKLEELEEINKKYEELFSEFISEFNGFPKIQSLLEKLKEMSLKVKERNCQMVFEIMLNLYPEKTKEIEKVKSYIS